MTTNEKLQREEIRYKTTQAQMKEQLDAAANDRNPMLGIARALLHAELHEKNEATHQRVLREIAEEQEPVQ